MKLNIKKFAGDPWELTTSFSNYKYNTNGELIQVTLTIIGTYNISSIYDIDNEGNEIDDYSSWENHSASDSYPHAEMPYIRRTFYNLNNLKGVKLVTYESPNTQTQTIIYNFKMATEEPASTTYLTKTSATAVLKGNVLNSLNTYDYNNAPSVAAVRNYLDSGSFVHQSDIESIVSQAVSNALLAAHPIGSIEINVSGINPGTYLGGTWESFGTGKTLVGIDASQTEFNTIEKTGGSKIHSHNYGLKVGGYYVDTILAESTADGVFTWDSNNNRTLMNLNSSIGNQSVNVNGGNATSSKSTNMAHYQAIANTSYTSNLQPYITVYFWKRIS